MSKKLRNWGVEKPQNVIPKTVKPHAKKNRRRWCKGKEGVEHQPHIVPDRPWCKPCHWGTSFYRGYHISWRCRHRLRCQVCEKVLLDVVAVEDCPDLRPKPQGPLPCDHCAHPDVSHESVRGPWNHACTLCDCRGFWWAEKP